MKDVKDYIEETAPNTQRITSLACYLDPKMLNSAFEAKLLKAWVEGCETDEEFSEVFDGATKEEATQYLEQWELCFMASWGAPELTRAIILSDDSRNEALALRAVSLAQQVQELPEAFTPMIGIQWAIARGYLIDVSTCKWVGVQHGEYGHPGNPLPNTGAQLQALPDAGAGSKQERDLTKWMRETWVKEGKPKGTAFFDSLKKYVNMPGSPIVEHYTVSIKGAGIRWNTGNATANMTKKAIQSRVSIFKNEQHNDAQQNTVNR